MQLKIMRVGTTYRFVCARVCVCIHECIRSLGMATHDMHTTCGWIIQRACGWVELSSIALLFGARRSCFAGRGLCVLVCLSMCARARLRNRVGPWGQSDQRRRSYWFDCFRACCARGWLSWVFFEDGEKRVRVEVREAGRPLTDWLLLCLGDLARSWEPADRRLLVSSRVFPPKRRQGNFPR